MAYFVEMAQSTGTAGVTVSANMPSHQADDILIAYVTLDTGTITLPAGWNALPSAPANPVTNGIVTYLAYIKAATAAETFSVTTADAYTIGIYCFRDVDTTTPFDGVTPVNTTGTTGYTVTSSAVTTNTADALVVYLVAQETPSTTPSSVLVNPGVMWIDGFDSTGVTATTSAHQAAAWYINRATGASPTPTFQSNVTSTFTRATFALRNKSGGRIPAYIDDVTAPALCLTHAHHVGTTAIGGVTFPAALTSTANINGKTTATSTATLGADFGINPYASGAGRTAAITAATALNGFEVNFSATKNFTTGLLMGSLIALNPKSGTFGLGSIAQGGLVARVGSGATNWEAYQIAAKDTNVTTENRYIFAIQPGDTTTDYGTPGSATNTAAVKYVQILMNCPAFAANVYLSELHQVYTQVVSGGDDSFPVDVDGLVAVGKSFILPVFQKTGASGMVANAPIQIGGGDAVNFQVDSGVIQFPRIYDTAKKEIAYHAAINKVGISYAGKSGDVIKHTNSLVSAPSEYYWEIHPSATSAAAWDFSGLSIVGAKVTLRPVVTFTAMTFTNCTGGVTTTGSTITNCSFINTKAVASSPANAALISGCTFDKTAGTNYAIEITGTAANITLSGNLFTGYAASNGSTGNEAIFVNIASGTMNITIGGGGSTPSIRTAGATVNVISGATVTFTGLPVGTDIVILTAGTSTILQQVDSHGSTSYAWGYSGTPTVDVGFIKPGYVPQYIRNLALSSSDSSIPVSLSVDRNYQ
jgi:hypothetical protein